MTSAPELGQSIIVFAIPSGHPNYGQIVREIEPMFHEFTEYFSVCWTHHHYSVLDTNYNQQQATSIALRYTDIDVSTQINKVDPEATRHLIYGDPVE